VAFTCLIASVGFGVLVYVGATTLIEAVKWAAVTVAQP
jgi:hypothetical protein